MSQPLGTVTFMFTDVEGSTRLWETHPTDMGTALARHDEILRAAVADYHGHVFTTAGDSFAVAFARAEDAVNAAIDAQRHLAAEPWPESTPIRVRMGLHTGEAQERDGDYFGSAVNRAARIMSLAHGQQILLSRAAHNVVSDADLGELGFLELGSHRLKGLTNAELLYQLTSPGLRREFPGISSAEARPGNVPTPIDPLIGRDSDLASVDELLSTQRLVTIVGVGGIGKTTLALEAARRIADQFADGVWLCELAEIGSAEAVPAAIGQAIGCRQHPGLTMTQSIAEFCRQRQMLLVLDNCEHVLDTVGNLVDAVLANATGVSVLATSREALGSRREQTYLLGPLEVTVDHSPAVELFIRRAEQSNPSIKWDESQLSAASTICRRLDGMPLAIELAASRTRAMSPIDIETHLNDAFRLLRGGRQSIERHRTLQAAIDWSYASLSEAERTTFQMLAVFSGSWNLDAAVFLGRTFDLDEFDVIDHISELVAKSLLTTETGSDGSGWYRLLEPLRQYAEDALATNERTDIARSAHLDYYLQWAEQWSNQLPISGLEWKTSLFERFSNLRAAMAWGIATGDTERATTLISHLGFAQQAFLLFEIGDWAEQVLGIPGVDRLPNGALAASSAAMTHWWRADIPGFIHLAQKAQAMAGPDFRHVYTVSVEALLARVSGDAEAAVSTLDRADRSQTVADIFASYMKLALAPSIIEDEMARLQDRFETSTSRWVEAILCLFTARDHQMQHRSADAARAARQGHSAAANIGATFYRHHCVFALSDSLGPAEVIAPEDAVTLASTLREQRDAGQELDQWLVLIGLDLFLYRFGRPSLAISIRRGFGTTVWASVRPRRAFPTVTEDGELDQAAFPDPSAPPSNGSDLPLVDLVDEVLTVLDELAHTSPPSHG